MKVGVTMDIRKVLIAAPAITYCNYLKEAIDRRNDFNVVDIATDGITTLACIDKYVPDILIMDLMLPGIDGVGILKKLCTQSSPPAVIGISSFMNDYVQTVATKYGVSFLLPTPVSAEDIIEHMTRSDFVNRLKDPLLNNITLDRDIAYWLSVLNIPQEHKCYPFLFDAVKICVLDSNAIYSVNKCIYEVLGQKYFYPPLEIYRKITRALNESFAHDGVEIFAKHFLCFPQPGKVTPALQSCIASIAEKIRVGY